MKVAASPRIYMGRCPKVVCKSLVLRFLNNWHVSQLLTSHSVQKLTNRYMSDYTSSGMGTDFKISSSTLAAVFPAKRASPERVIRWERV